MGVLVKYMDGILHVVKGRVATPEGTVYSHEQRSAYGWTYYDEDLEDGDFAAPWVQPTGAHDAYPIGAIVSHNSTRWRSTILGNVWEPGVSGWVDADSDVPAWGQPTGAHDAYSKEAVVAHNGKLWKSMIDANVWAPGVSGWREVALMPPSGEVAPPAWVQPTGGHDAYQIGDRVTHNEQTWTSTAANNVWAPGVYGWTAD